MSEIFSIWLDLIQCTTVENGWIFQLKTILFYSIRNQRISNHVNNWREEGERESALMICFYNVFGSPGSSVEKIWIFSQSKNQDLHNRETRNHTATALCLLCSDGKIGVLCIHWFNTTQYNTHYKVTPCDIDRVRRGYFHTGTLDRGVRGLSLSCGVSWR